MAHRTTNPLTAFYGDLRETQPRKNHVGRTKYQEATQLYQDVFGRKYASYLGAAYDMYADLEEAGFVWSSRYGWRKRQA